MNTPLLSAFSKSIINSTLSVSYTHLDVYKRQGYRCTNLPEFQAAFADALKQKGPTWIECIIDKDEKVLPMIPGGGDINDIIME